MAKSKGKARNVTMELKNALEDALEKLAKYRQCFHSEDDFKFALARCLASVLPNSRVRLEVPYYPKVGGKEQQRRRRYLDVLIQNANSAWAVELKYRTAKLSARDKCGDCYDLTSQSARNLGRYAFVKDLCRLEERKKNGGFSECAAVFLTNDSLYWDGGEKNAVDSAFHIYDGITLENGWKEWGDVADYIRKKYPPIYLCRSYKMEWMDYPAKRLGAKNDRFRFLISQVHQE